MTDRPAEAATAAETSLPHFPINALVDADASFPLVAAAQTSDRVRDVLAMLDHLEPTDSFSSSAATGIHWTLQTCMDALQCSHDRLMQAVRRHG